MNATITNIKDNVDLIEIDGKKIYLVGTAHVSQSSVDLATQTIEEYKPAVVAIELCSPRYESINDPERWKKTDISKVIRSGRSGVLIAQLILAAFQKKIGAHLNVQPGAEMLAAAKAGKAAGSEIALVDREIRITMKRIWGALGLRAMYRLLHTGLTALLDDPKISSEEIEKIKSKESLEKLLKEFTVMFPEIQTALIDERDRYMAAKLRDIDAPTIVAVIGAGHTPGIKNWINKPIDLAELEVLPPPRLIGKLFVWGIPALVTSFIVYGFFAHGGVSSGQMIWSWVWISGLSAAFGSIITLAHPLSILTALVTAPFTSFHAGIFAGLVEAWVRKPQVTDLQSITTDILSVRGVFRNRVLRVLLILIVTKITAAVGSVIAAKVVASYL